MNAEIENYFVCVGAQKSGTTWLYNYLQNHSEVNVPAIKELHIFDRIYVPQVSGWMTDHYRDLLEQLNINSEKSAVAAARYETMCEMVDIPHLSSKEEIVDRYRTLLRKGLGEQHRVFGEITPCYALLPSEGIQFVLKSFPLAKFVLLLRDPVDRYWSQLWHQTRLDSDFDPITNFESHLGKSGFGERSMYNLVIDKYRSIVPAQMLHVSFYEDLFNYERERELNRITDFLGITYQPGNLDEIVYSNTKRELPGELRNLAINHFKDAYNYSYPNGPVPDSWQKHN